MIKRERSERGGRKPSASYWHPRHNNSIKADIISSKAGTTDYCISSNLTSSWPTHTFLSLSRYSHPPIFSLFVVSVRFFGVVCIILCPTTTIKGIMNDAFKRIFQNYKNFPFSIQQIELIHFIYELLAQSLIYLIEFRNDTPKMKHQVRKVPTKMGWLLPNQDRSRLFVHYAASVGTDFFFNQKQPFSL